LQIHHASSAPPLTGGRSRSMCRLTTIALGLDITASSAAGCPAFHHFETRSNAVAPRVGGGYKSAQ